MGKPTTSIPERSIKDLSIDAVPSRMVFYSYMFRPNYMVRERVAHRVKAFQLRGSKHDDKVTDGGGGKKKRVEVWAAMHVRRGDVLFHEGAARFYITVETYMRAATPYIRALGVTCILLLTDSQAVIDEALACEKDFPDICRGISWRFVEKKRWFGAEGGWENPFPSGNALEEFINIQVEYTLAQQCDLMIMGNSGYGDLVYNHMCCGFPLHDRGEVPHRCICPPKVRVEQGGFTCEQGNKVVCPEHYETRGGDITMKLDDPRNTKTADFSKTKEAFMPSGSGVKVWLTSLDSEHSFNLNEFSDTKVSHLVEKSAQQAREEVCKRFEQGPQRRVVC